MTILIDYSEFDYNFTVLDASPSTADLQTIARRLRRNVVSMIAASGSGHPGGSLSAADIITTLYFRVMHHDPKNPAWPDRDRFVLSKGHAAPILYAALSECGYIPQSELMTLRKLGSRLQGHPDRNLTPGVDMSTGSLGQGLSVGLGMALAGKLDSRNYRVYVLLGDGECQEGQVWEAAMAGAHFKADNLVAIIDHNQLQLDDRCCNVMNLEPLPDKFRAFGWNVIEANGHDIDQLLAAFGRAKAATSMPTAIVAHTVKGKGVSFMENNVDWHGKAPNPEETKIALKELE
jgi:transketolase